MVLGMCALMFLPLVRKTRKRRAWGKEMSPIWYMLKVRCLKHSSKWSGRWRLLRCSEVSRDDYLPSVQPLMAILPGTCPRKS